MKSVLAFPKFSSKCSNRSIYMNLHRKIPSQRGHDLKPWRWHRFSHRFFFTGRKFLKQQKLDMVTGNSSESFQVSKNHRLGWKRSSQEGFCRCAQNWFDPPSFYTPRKQCMYLKWETDGIGKPNF